MTVRYEVPEYMQHPAWLGEAPDVIKPGGLNFARPDDVDQWIVKLQWLGDGRPAFGTGFFVNIPEVTAYDVILTAAHNLTNTKGQLSQNLLVHLPQLDQNPDPQMPPADPIPVPESQFRICDGYLVRPDPGTDWGAIVLPRNGQHARPGFGFSLRLAFFEDLKGDVFVSGYRVTGDAASNTVKTSSGRVKTYNNSLEYHAETEQGISGSPVWYAYEGEPVVVAIHNSRPAWKNGGSRGARLNLDLLQVVFGWFGVGRYNVQLRAKAEAAPKRKSKVPSTTTTQDVLPTKGLFLYFKDGWETARVKLGSGSSFDVLPVHTKSGSMNIDHCRYAMKLGARWVFFNGVRGEVTLADQLKNGCFFTESNIKRNAGRTKVVTPAVSGQRRYQLKVQKTMIDEDDEDSQESSEVYMARYPEDDAEPFNWFWFE